VHTHPNVLPNPSGNDERVAERLGMPVYVVTRGSISMTAGLRRTKVLVLGDWNPARCR
jgi:proteasome lid subunit RPN8/RPN11